jgi:DNA-binding NtrC family response regulator
MLPNTDSHTNAAAGDSASVLVVDDESLIRWAIKESLQWCGHHVAEASTAQEAIAVAERNMIDVILLDHCLPDCRDFSLLEALHRLAPSAAIIVISCCADGFDFAARAMKLGACRVFPKPFDLDRLRGVIGEVQRGEQPVTPRALDHTQILLDPGGRFARP